MELRVVRSRDRRNDSIKVGGNPDAVHKEKCGN